MVPRKIHIVEMVRRSEGPRDLGSRPTALLLLGGLGTGKASWMPYFLQWNTLIVGFLQERSLLCKFWYE